MIISKDQEDLIKTSFKDRIKNPTRFRTEIQISGIDTDKDNDQGSNRIDHIQISKLEIHKIINKEISRIFNNEINLPIETRGSNQISKLSKTEDKINKEGLINQEDSQITIRGHPIISQSIKHFQINFQENIRKNPE